MNMEGRVRRLETKVERVERESRHLGEVMATQREVIQKAFAQVSLALLEQQMAFTSFADRISSEMGDFVETHRDYAKDIEDIKRRLDRLEKPA